MSYVIAGRAIKNEYIALATILSTVGVAVAATSGGEKKSATAGPAPVAQDQTITGDSAEEVDFIRQFVAEAEKDEKAH
ncbi:hypothetical protein IAT38_004938 [Cryptococcus sp. DSM 104549]